MMSVSASGVMRRYLPGFRLKGRTCDMQKYCAALIAVLLTPAICLKFQSLKFSLMFPTLKKHDSSGTFKVVLLLPAWEKKLQFQCNWILSWPGTFFHPVRCRTSQTTDMPTLRIFETLTHLIPRPELPVGHHKVFEDSLAHILPEQGVVDQPSLLLLKSLCQSRIQLPPLLLDGGLQNGT